MTPGLTRSRQSDVHEKGVGCVARSDIDPPYGKASSATPVSGARKRAPRRVRRSRSKAQAASRLRALTGEETNSSRSQGAAMAIGSNPLRSTILSMTYRDGQRIEVHRAESGQWMTAKVPQGNNCRVDLRGKYADGQSADASNVDVCADPDQLTRQRSAWRGP
jgi:hypothetical protein